MAIRGISGTNAANGIYGESSNAAQGGVVGANYSSSGFGTYGYCTDSSTGVGAYGLAIGGTGVKGQGLSASRAVQA